MGDGLEVGDRVQQQESRKHGYRTGTVQKLTTTPGGRPTVVVLWDDGEWGYHPITALEKLQTLGKVKCCLCGGDCPKACNCADCGDPYCDACYEGHIVRCTGKPRIPSMLDAPAGFWPDDEM